LRAWLASALARNFSPRRLASSLPNCPRLIAAPRVTSPDRTGERGVRAERPRELASPLGRPLGSARSGRSRPASPAREPGGHLRQATCRAPCRLASSGSSCQRASAAVMARNAAA
jgi:hypothetical protein